MQALDSGRTVVVGLSINMNINTDDASHFMSSVFLFLWLFL